MFIAWLHVSAVLKNEDTDKGDFLKGTEIIRELSIVRPDVEPDY